MIKMKVKLIDYTREPLKVLAQVTLVSYWDEWSIDKLEEITEKDAEMHLPRILNYGHESILEHVVLTFAVEDVSVVTLKQITRHRLMSFTVRSQRYIFEEAGGKEEVFHANNLDGQPRRIKVSNDPLELFVIPKSLTEIDSEIIETPDGDYILEVYDSNEGLREEVEEFFRQSYALYRKLIKRGIPPEDARFVLPQAVKTKFTVTMNFREFKHFIGLRLCERAQWEIRELARKMWEEVYKVDELRPILKWAKVGPRCIQLGYCPERELMPDGCWKRQREWWEEVWGDEE